MVTGAVDHSWNPNANSRVTALTRTGNRLFIGGDFTTIDGQAKSGLAEIDLASGNLVSGFTMNLSGDLGNGGPIVRELMVTPNGQRLIIAHRAATIAGQVRRAAAIVDLSGSTPPEHNGMPLNGEPGGEGGPAGVGGQAEADGEQLFLLLGKPSTFGKQHHP